MKRHIKTAKAFAHLMDNKFSVFGFKFGLDSLIGLIPGAGDVVTTILSLYLVWVGIQMKIPGNKIAEMVFNLVVDFLIGAFPIIGDVSDVFFKANTKNLRILEDFDSNTIEGEVERV